MIDMTRALHTLLLVLDLFGTFVFALSGALVAVRRGLDLFGVLVLSFVASSAGGIIRDLLIGATPPAAIQDWRYVAVSMLAGLVTFFRHADIERMRNPMQLSDAAGLALFAVSGAQKALAYGLHPGMAALLGMLTGIGGGMLRDVLVSNIPVVFRGELYAVTALGGATVVVLGGMLDMPPVATTLAGAGLCFGLRFMAIRYGWQLPVASPTEAGERK